MARCREAPAPSLFLSEPRWVRTAPLRRAHLRVVALRVLHTRREGPPLLRPGGVEAAVLRDRAEIPSEILRRLELQELQRLVGRKLLFGLICRVLGALRSE